MAVQQTGSSPAAAPAGAPDAATRLAQRIDLAARMMRTMQAQLHRSESLLAALQAHEQRVSGACARAEHMARALDARISEARRAAAPPPQAQPSAAPAARQPAPAVPSPTPTPKAQAAPPDRASTPARPPQPDPAPPPSAQSESAPAPPAAAAAPVVGNDSEVDDIRALHTLIDDLVARCAILERDRITAVAAERTLLAGLHQELREGLQDLGRTLDALNQSRLDESQRDLIDPAVVSIGALADLVAGLRDLAPDQGAGQGGEAAAFDLRDAVNGVVQFLAHRATERSIELVCSIAQDVPPVVVGDRALLRQITLHLVHAALRLASPGRVDVEVAVDALAEDHASIRISVAHDGAGISPEALRKADAAPAGDESAAEDGVADLAGIAVARRLVERLGGRLGVESVEDERFTLWFNIIWQRPDRHGADRRTDNRLRVSAVESSLGPVLDLSLGGARVRSKKRLAGRASVEIRAAGEVVALEAEVSWSRRVGLRKFESGLRFLDVTPDAARKLTRISMQHRVRAMLGGDG